MATVRTDLLRQWRAQLPANAPNRFVINIQPDQVGAVQARLKELGILDATAVPDGARAAGGDQQRSGRPGAVSGRTGPRPDRARIQSVLCDRSAVVQPDRSGSLFGSDSAELSIERGIADTLGIHLGDRLSFDVGGEIVQASATSVRELSWDSMKVNFSS